MVEITKGNLLEAPVEALVNTVNTEGVMGKGIALQFKQAYPQMFKAYEEACERGKVQLGRMFVYDLGGLVGGPRWIINFPTKSHWRSRSRLADIEAGLRDLVLTIQEHSIDSIAVPPLGCGHGGLKWEEVRPRIVAALEPLKGVHVLVYAPEGAPDAKDMPNRTERPNMTPGRAALIGLMDRYLKGLLDPVITLLEVHKLMYFLQAAGEPLKLEFQAKIYGPYAPNLRHVLTKLEQHYTSGYGDGEDSPKKAIELLPSAVNEAEKFLADHPTTNRRIDRVVALIEGFEDPYGMELLSSVHWIMRGNPIARTNPDAAITAVQAWNSRKRRLLKGEHIRAAWERLTTYDWASSETLPQS